MVKTSESTMEHTAELPAAPGELDAIKQRQRATWASGDFGIIGTTLQIVGETLCEAVDLRSGSKVLDVAAGNGNCSLAAARRWCSVTSTDYVPALLEDGRRRAEAERLAIEFQEVDAEALPFEDGRFDVVLSSFGVMFTPNHARAAGELLRVCRPGGRIGLANWTSRSFIGKLFGVVGRHVPPPTALTPPSRWGSEGHLEHLFSASARELRMTPRDFVFRYRSPEHWVEVFRTWYGPVHKAFAALPAEKQGRLEQDLLALIAEFNVSGDATMVVPSEYLEVVIVKK
ncbi:MAG TPA: class I SAM-dependent methyltransferase [Vicinamibacterales bacterium]|nr:class I SAM-dependent methyltransferase [Vicinamibacterales bacterium]